MTIHAKQGSNDMDLIEQAVFTSAETDRAAGYQVVATSPGVAEADARELAVWGPSHDALLDSTPNASSLNFHPLPSGNYCVSRTAPAGWEYSGRGGARVYTQCLIVPPRTLARFANNPFALSRAALAAGSLRLYDEVPKQLPPLRMAGRAPVVDSTLLARLCSDPGPDWLALLVETALRSGTVAVSGGPRAEQVIAGLVNCLPPECRLEYSFSTGLKFSSRRPFRVIAVSRDPEEQRRVKRLYDVAVLDLSGHLPEESVPRESWARFIHRVLKLGRPSLLSTRLSNRQHEFSPDDLPALGLQLLEELDASCLDSGTTDEPAAVDELPIEDLGIAGVRPERISDDAGDVPRHASPRPVEDDQPGGEAWSSPDPRQQAHQAHRRFEKNASPAVASIPGSPVPSQLLDPDSPEVLRKLERLDDLVYGAVNGTPAAMEELRVYWPQVQNELGGTLLAESQEQYLRYALAAWNQSREPEASRDPARTVQALEVLTLLFDEI